MLSARPPKCFSPYFRTISDSLAFCLTVPMWLFWQPETWRCYIIECRDFSRKGCFFFLKKKKNMQFMQQGNTPKYSILCLICQNIIFSDTTRKNEFVFHNSGSKYPFWNFSWPSVPFAIKYMSWTLCRIITFDYVYLSKTKLSFFIFSQND